MRRFYIILFLLLQGFGVDAQRGGDGGLVINNIFYNNQILHRNGNFLQTHDSSVVINVERWSISEKASKQKKLEKFPDIKQYDVKGNRPCLLYCAPYYNSVIGKVKTANQRLILSRGNEKMIIDFYDILVWTMDGSYNQMASIHFQPGYYNCYLNPLKKSQEIKEHQYDGIASSVYRSLEEGINTGDNEILYKYGILQYFVPGKKKGDWQISRPVLSQEAYLHLSTIGSDSIIFIVNGRVLSDGKCDSGPLINLQIFENNHWTDFAANWTQESCTVNEITCANLTKIINIHQLKYPNTSAPLKAGKYRYAAINSFGQPIYSAEFEIKSSPCVYDNKYENLFRISMGNSQYYEKGKSLLIYSPQNPEIIEGVPFLYFHYYWIPRLNLSHESYQMAESNNKYFSQFVSSIDDLNLVYNDRAYSGKVKYAVSSEGLFEGKIRIYHTIYEVQYEEGSIVSFEKKEVVDLKTEKFIEY